MENKRKRPDLAERNRQNAIHRMNGTRTYRIWKGMKERCYKESRKDFASYGGRGIVMCDEWKNSFVNFLADMGEAPENMSIDRINGDGIYEKSNCRWATLEQQANNRRTCIYVTFNGETKTVAQWSRDIGIERKTLEYRIRVGWDVEKALTTPSTIKRK